LDANEHESTAAERLKYACKTMRETGADDSQYLLVHLNEIEEVLREREYWEAFANEYKRRMESLVDAIHLAAFREGHEK
jgi:hypothetical protein